MCFLFGENLSPWKRGRNVEKQNVLFSPIQVGSLRIPNRLEMTPMGTRYGSRGGYLTEKLRAYYEARARGGTGLITVEATFVKPEGRLGVTQLGAHEDGCIPGLTTLAESIKSHGTRASIELNHGGIQANPAAAPRIEGPAAIRRKNQQGKPLPKKLTTEEVEEIVELFGDAAVRCQSAGFDMVQVHGTHGYLVNEFLSPVTNRRSDKYGMDRLLFCQGDSAKYQAKVWFGVPS